MIATSSFCKKLRLTEAQQNDLEYSELRALLANPSPRYERQPLFDRYVQSYFGLGYGDTGCGCRGSLNVKRQFSKAFVQRR
jgi:hypothetical protein